MKVVYSAKHRLHSPAHEVQSGVPIPSFEAPSRADRILQALQGDARFSLQQPSEHGLAPIEAVHDRGLVRYLERAWADWDSGAGQSPGPKKGPEIFPDTVIHPALREGMTPFHEPRAPIGQVGFWCFETMTPILAGTYEAARAAVDVALTAAELVLGGERLAYGLCRPPGHHAARAAFGGYCYFNNAAIVAEHLARQTQGPVAILDVDYHHGNGTQQIFYRRGDVMYVSLHADPERAFPFFIGFADEVGEGEGRGANLNIPLPAATADREYLAALQRGLEVIERFRAPIVVVSLGFDTYERDPIGDFALTTAMYRRIGSEVARLQKRLVILQEGGYFVDALGENARQFLFGVDPA